MKNLIFDFDGVIQDTLCDVFFVHNKTLEEISLEDLREKVFNGNAREYMKKFSLEKKELFEQEWKKCCENLVLDDKIKNSLLTLKQKYDLYIVSSNSEENLNIFFKNNNFEGVFKKVLGHETHDSKVEKFKFLFQTYDFTNNDCFFITDTLGDILEAKEVGVKTIAVDFGYHKRETLVKGDPYKLISSFDEIFLILK